MTIPTKILHSTTPGNKPSVLVSGQLAINEADASLYYLDPATGLPSNLIDQGTSLTAQTNLAINGAMEVDQVRVGALQSAVANTAYVIDMAKYSAAGAQVVSAQQVTDAPAGLLKSLKLAVTTANASPGASDICAIQFPIEGRNIARLGFGATGPTGIVIGFYVKMFRAGTYAICVTNGAGNRNYSTSFTVAAIATWQWVSVAIPGDVTGTWATDDTAGMLVSIVMMAGSARQTTPNVWTAGNILGVLGMTNGCATISDFMQITGVCVFPGHVTITAARGLIVHRIFADALAACSRYWQKSYNHETLVQAITDTGAHSFVTIYQSTVLLSTGMAVRLPIHMRATPTLTIYSSATGTAGNVRDNNNATDVAITRIDNLGQKGFTVIASMAVTGLILQLTFHWTADARL